MENACFGTYRRHDRKDTCPNCKDVSCCREYTNLERREKRTEKKRSSFVVSSPLESIRLSKIIAFIG